MKSLLHGGTYYLLQEGTWLSWWVGEWMTVYSIARWKVNEPNQWYSSGAVAGRSWYGRGTVEVRLWCG